MDSHTLPLVSVVMPSLNQGRFIGDAIASVVQQSYPRIELIVADGGSGDGTQALLADWQARDPRIRWFSAPDAGPADALNKALALARGTVIGWLNADDLYVAGAVDRALGALRDNRELVAVYGHGEHVDEHGRLLGRYPSEPPTVPVDRFLDGCFICQPTLFFLRSAHLMLGPFDTQLQTAFDFEYWLRLFTRMPGRTGFVDAVQAQSRLHKDCITQRMRRSVALEGLIVLQRHLGRAPLHWVLTHITEILDGAAPEAATAEQRARIADFLSAARGYLTSGERQYLARQWGPADA